MTQPPPSSAHPHAISAPEAPAPRAFAQGVGLLTQAVGAIVLFVTCCLCCGVAFVEGEVWQNRSPAEAIQARPHDPSSLSPSSATVGHAVLLAASAVGGLCLVGFGVGLQADRGRLPAIGSAASTLAMLAAYAFAILRLVQGNAGLGFIILATALALAAAGLCALTIPACAQVVRHPPENAAPPVTDEAPDDPWARKRDEEGNLILTPEQAQRREKELLAELQRLRARSGASPPTRD